MRELIIKPEFWVAVIAATLLKFKASPPLTKRGAFFTVLAGVLSAAVFTDPIVVYLNIEAVQVHYGIAGLVVLTCEHFARLVLSLKPSDFIKPRGK